MFLSVILRLSCFLILHESQQMYFLLSDCAVVSPDEAQRPLCLTDAWELFWHPQGQMQKMSWRAAAGWSSSARGAGRGTSQFRNSIWGSGCTAATDLREGRKGKLFAVNFCKHIRELCWHPVCTVWRVFSAGSECKTFLHSLQLCTHVETIHLHQWRGRLGTGRNMSGSGLFRHTLNYFSDFPEKWSGRYDLLSPILPYFYAKESPSMFIKPGFCNLWAASPKNMARAAERQVVEATGASASIVVP